MSRICLCLTASTLRENLGVLKLCRDNIDMAELRVDLLSASELDRLDRLADFPARCPVPLVLTIRLPEDGGHWGGENAVPGNVCPGSAAAGSAAAGRTLEEQREELFVHLLKKGGWAFVDLEEGRPLERAVSAARQSQTRIIRSLHHFGQAPEKPEAGFWADRLKNMASEDVIPKLAFYCRSSRDVLALAHIARLSSDVPEKVILGMGEYGMPTRILARRMGSLWTYAFHGDSLDDDSPGAKARPAAPGQLSARELDELYRFREITAQTPLFGLLGNPVSHSRSPRIHNTWFREQGLPGAYLAMRTDDVPAALETGRIWGMKGFSVTVPHKAKALELSVASGTLARRIGAANTLLAEGEGWRAENTDAPGFIAALVEALVLKEASALAGMKALVIGAGGAARAAVHALDEAGVKVIILNRTPEKARLLAGEVGARWGGLEQDSAALLVNGADIAVQTTSAGMAPMETVNPLPWWNFRNCRLAFDMVYAPEETVFLARARSLGIKTANGLSMLQYQAALQFDMFRKSAVTE